MVKSYLGNRKQRAVNIQQRSNNIFKRCCYLQMFAPNGENIEVLPSLPKYNLNLHMRT